MKYTITLTVLLMLGQYPAHGQTASLGVFEGNGDIGTVLHEGSASYDPAAKSYKISAGGENMWAAADAFHYVWKKVSGDVRLSADITFPGTGGNAHRKGVLMIRQSLDADSAYADAARHGDGLTSLQSRETKGANTHEVQSNMSAPQRLRIEKRGNDMFMFVGGEGQELRLSGGSMRVPLQEPFYIGLGVCAHDKDAVETVTFSNVEFVALPAGKETTQTRYSTLETVPVTSTDRRTSYVTTDRIEAPSWSPDGTSLFFNSDGKVWRVPMAGGVPEQVSKEPSQTGQERSPDGQYTYSSSGDGGKLQIWRTPADGSAPEQLTSGEQASRYPHPSPDGKQLAFLTEEPAEGASPLPTVTLRVMTLVDKKVRVIAKFYGGPGTLDAPCWSPDSRRITFVSWQLLPGGPPRP